MAPPAVCAFALNVSPVINLSGMSMVKAGMRVSFGLEGATACTLEEIGDRFGVSRERIRQLEARALKLMRGICEEQGLQELLH